MLAANTFIVVENDEHEDLLPLQYSRFQKKKTPLLKLKDTYSSGSSSITVPNSVATMIGPSHTVQEPKPFPVF